MSSLFKSNSWVWSPSFKRDYKEIKTIINYLQIFKNWWKQALKWVKQMVILINSSRMFFKSKITKMILKMVSITSQSNKWCKDWQIKTKMLEETLIISNRWDINPQEVNLRLQPIWHQFLNKSNYNICSWCSNNSSNQTSSNNWLKFPLQ